MIGYPNGFIEYLLNLLIGIQYFAWIRGGDYYFMKKNRAKSWMIQRVIENSLTLSASDGVI
jgi:hypothetical protein